MPSSSTNRNQCPICQGERVAGCKCPSRFGHTVDDLKKGHGSRCKNGHLWSYDQNGNVVTLQEEDKKPKRSIRLKKSKELPLPDKDTLKMLVEFIGFASQKLNLGEEPVVVTLLHANPGRPITTGAFDPQDKSICVIVGGRHFIDYCRTIAHELTHLKQAVNNELIGEIQEIGGKIEDDANASSGRIVKEYLKSVLTKEQKEKLGLGSF